MPKEYLNPAHYEDIESAKLHEANVRQQPRRKSKEKEYWFVISDRSNNYTYRSKSLDSEKKSQLDYRDITYVLEDNIGWLRLSSDKESGVDLGWIPKSNVLQWRRSLHDSRSNISLKGFCRPMLINFIYPLSKAVNIYDSPYCSNLLTTADIDPLCYIYKIQRDSEGFITSYLIAHNQEFSSRSCSEDLIGWVKSADVTVWSSNVCLEVNANRGAVEERLQNPRYKVRAVATKNQAEKVAAGNFARVNNRVIYWEESLDSGSLHLLREPVEHFRFPVFDQDSLTYSSKLIASFPSEYNANNSQRRKFTPEVLGILRRQLNSHIGVRLLDEQVGDHVADTEFIANVYLPKKQPNQVYNPFSIVLFMSENDLKSYVEELNILSFALDLPMDKTRKQLQALLTDLARKFLASDLSEVMDMEIEDVLDMMAGIEREGFDIVSDMGSSCQLGDLNNKKKCSDQAITKLGDSIMMSKAKLESIIKSKPPYEFQYKTDKNTFYWIPIEYL